MFGFDYKQPFHYMITMRKNWQTPAFSTIIHPSDSGYMEDVFPVGRIVRKQLVDFKYYYPSIHIMYKALMPDHVHFMVHVKERLEWDLSFYIGLLKGRCSTEWWRRYPAMNGYPLFEEGFHDRIMMSAGQFDKIKNYIQDNPRRLWIKQHNPELFCEFHQLYINGRIYDAVGNMFLLDDFGILPVKNSSHDSSSINAYKKALWIHASKNGGVLASPFLNQEEKIYRDMALDNIGKVILFQSEPFQDKFKPAGRYFDVCNEGRLLILAPREPIHRHKYINKVAAEILNEAANAISLHNYIVIR